MRTVTSPDNAKLKFIRQLKTRKGRDRTGCYLVEGPKLLGEALKSRVDVILAVFCGEDADDEELAIASALEAAGADVLAVDGKVFSQLPDAETPQGVLAAVRKHEPGISAGDWLVLDRVQEPGNIGALMRTADAAGFRTVVTVKGSGDVYAPKAVRASAGAVFRMAVSQAGSGLEAMEMARQGGRLVLAADPEGQRSVYGIDMKGELALVIGNEGGGLAQEFRQGGAIMARIPMPGGAESLNAATAAAIIMFEAVRQREIP